MINLPEMRLYRFFPRIGAVKTYPVGIGGQHGKTPEGTCWVVDRRVDPTWVVPASLKEKYDVPMIPPGPENPLGRYWLGLSRKGYGIHGTDFPWCVGRAVSNGCIRLYPEHIEQLFGKPPVGIWVEIVYEPVKVGFRRGEISSRSIRISMEGLTGLKNMRSNVCRNPSVCVVSPWSCLGPPWKSATGFLWPWDL